MLYLGYAIIFFRQPAGGVLEGPAIRGDARVQSTWIIVTSLMVLGLAVFGTVRLESGSGAGSGSGPSPLVVPKGPKLPVQVIAQQWLFTYRYPTYGGVETTQLYLPVNRTIEFHVTSLDVIHGFWAYKLGVKADANPGVDNVAFVKPTKLQSFNVHCAELCGLWHGYMYGHRQGRHACRLQRLDREQQRQVQPGHEGASQVQHDLPTRTDEAWRMSTTSEAAPLPAADATPTVAQAARLQPADRGDPRRRRLLPWLVDRPSDQRPQLRIRVSDRRERCRAAARATSSA